VSKAVERIKVGKGLEMTVGHAALGFRGGVAGSVRQQVHDGDTVNVRAVGNFGVRFLGVDAPEISFTLPTEGIFRSLADPKWDAYLTNPFKTPFERPLSPGLMNHLKSRIGPGVAANHYGHAVAAERILEAEVTRDLEDLGQTEDAFRFFFAFAFEIMDRYGRFLCYINRDQSTGSRPRPYNERMLQTGVVAPYFIWPNVNPFRKNSTLARAVLAPKTAKTEANKDAKLRWAREAVRTARNKGWGIYDPTDPLRLQPFEVRLLARRVPPERWVIDLSKNEDLIYKPDSYYKIPNAEDRLYIPEEYVALWVEAGWRRET
jgi:endonuclease YncB( thermonuclease family)